MEMQAKHNKHYPDVRVGDKVKVYRSRGALSKEVEGDYRYAKLGSASIKQRAWGNRF